MFVINTNLFANVMSLVVTICCIWGSIS